MMGRIAAIVREADGGYLVTLETNEGELIGIFRFHMEDEREMVTWEADFASYLGVTPWPLNELFRAIVAFRHAQCLELPPKG